MTEEDFPDVPEPDDQLTGFLGLYAYMMRTF